MGNYSDRRRYSAAQLKAVRLFFLVLFCVTVLPLMALVLFTIVELFLRIEDPRLFGLDLQAVIPLFTSVVSLLLVEIKWKPLSKFMGGVGAGNILIWGSTVVCIAIPVYTGEAIFAFFCLLAWVLLVGLGDAMRSNPSHKTAGYVSQERVTERVKGGSDGLLAATTLGFAMKSDTLENEKRVLEAETRNLENENLSLQYRIRELESSLAAAERERDSMRGGW